MYMTGWRIEGADDEIGPNDTQWKVPTTNVW